MLRCVWMCQGDHNGHVLRLLSVPVLPAARVDARYTEATVRVEQSDALYILLALYQDDREAGLADRRCVFPC